jgi:hypothetical protein
MSYGIMGNRKVCGFWPLVFVSTIAMYSLNFMAGTRLAIKLKTKLGLHSLKNGLYFDSENSCGQIIEEALF